MLNVYLVYVSSVTGDVEVLKTVYTSFNKASEDLNTIVDQYVSDHKITSFRVFDKDTFDVKNISKDTAIPLETYCFAMKTSEVLIYKKVVLEGRLWNGAKLDMRGKIGISEINIPADQKLLRLIQSLNETPDVTPAEIPVAPPGPEDTFKVIKPGPSNYEHGQHVSFIQELKDRIERRNLNPVHSDVVTSKYESKIIKYQPTKSEFSRNIQTVKSNLKPAPFPEIIEQYIINKEAVNDTVNSLISTRRPFIGDSDESNYADDLSISGDLSDTHSDWDSDTGDENFEETLDDQIRPFYYPVEFQAVRKSEFYSTPSAFSSSVPLVFPSSVQSPSSITGSLSPESEIDRMVNEIMETLILNTTNQDQK